MLLGRDFNDRDDAGAPKVRIVNQKFVKRYFGDASPLGRHVGMGIDPGTKTDIQIVGVVGDTKYESMRDEMPYELYIPRAQQRFLNGGTVYVRAPGDPARITPLNPPVASCTQEVSGEVRRSSGWLLGFNEQRRGFTNTRTANRTPDAPGHPKF